MSRTRRIATIACLTVGVLSAVASFLVLPLNQPLVLVFMGVFIVCGFAAMILITQRRRPDEQVNFTMVPRWLQFVVGMGFTLSPCIAAVLLITAVLAWTEGLVFEGVMLLLGSIGFGLLTWWLAPKFERYIPR